MSDFSGINSLSAGDVLLYRTKSFMGRAIRLLDGSEVSHAALFLGDEVAEALVREGLIQRPVEKSINHESNWVAVMRLKAAPDSMAPVLEVARKYLDQANRYGYEQILLLAVICSTRKLDISSPLLRMLVRAAMRKAVDLINHWHGEGKEPMICSEFVFRTYDEALLEPNDPYSLEILSQAKAEPRRRFSRIRRRFGRSETAATEPLSASVHPESLLGRLKSSGETVESLPTSGMLKSVLPPVDDDLDALIEQYVMEAEGEKSTKVFAASAGPEVTDDELLDTARLFAAELAAAAGRTDEIKKTLYGAPPEAVGRAAPTFDEILADFVTPGDLLKSPSLKEVEKIYP